MKRVLVISSTLRKKGNSAQLAQAFADGATTQGHNVELISLCDKKINFCIGCLNCQKTLTCILKDDMNVIIEKMKNAEVIVFATPVYFYGMSGQLKTLLDRTNPLFPAQYCFRDIYLITSFADTDKNSIDAVVESVQGWISCFTKAKLKHVIYGSGLTDTNDVNKRKNLLDESFELGKNI